MVGGERMCLIRSMAVAWPGDCSGFQPVTGELIMSSRKRRLAGCPLPCLLQNSGRL